MNILKLHPSICAASIAMLLPVFAQEPAPIAPPVGTAPAAPAPGTPAVIDPPISIQPAGVPGVTPDATAPTTMPPTAARVFEFQNDDIGLVLRTLARQANINVMISDKVGASGSLVQARLQGVTPMQAIQTIVELKGLIIEERTNGTFFVKTQEEKAAEPAIPGNFTLSYATAKDVAPLLQTQLVSAMAPQIDTRTNTLFFKETKANMEKAIDFLKTIDKPTQQVMIEARLVEVTANPQQSYGINWGGVVGGSSTAQTFSYGGSNANTAQSTTNQRNSTGAQPFPDGTLNGTRSGDSQFQSIVSNTAGASQPLTDFVLKGGGSGLLNSIAGQFAILSVPQMSATLRFLNEDRDAEFLANPRVVTSNNMKAEIKILRKQPVPQLNFNEQTATAQFSGFQDKEFGNTLTVTPIINKDHYVTMSVKPEISNKIGDATFIFAGSTVTSPVIDSRTLESNVLIRSGDTLAIGGLLQDETTKGRTKVPILGDIPILGYAFQERLNSRTKRNLLIFVTPTIIKQGYGTGLEDQVTGVKNSGDEFADPNGWRNNAKGAWRGVPTSDRQLAADYPVPGAKKVGFKKAAPARER